MQRLTAILVLVMLLALVVGGGGCARRAKIDVPVTGLALQPEYPTLVEVDNFKGSVRVIVDPSKPPAVWADIRASGKDAPRRKGEIARLATVKAVSSIEDGQRMLSVVSAREPGDVNVAVDVTVRIARSAGTSVRNSGGVVELTRVAGPVHVENGIGGQAGGDIRVWTGAAMTHPAHLRTTRGSVLYQIGPGSAGIFDLRSEKAQADFMARVGRVDRVTASRDRWQGVLNDGRNAVVLHGPGMVRVSVIVNAGTYAPARLDGYLPATWMARLRGE